MCLDYFAIIKRENNCVLVEIWIIWFFKLFTINFHQLKAALNYLLLRCDICKQWIVQQVNNFTPWVADVRNCPSIPSRSASLLYVCMSLLIGTNELSFLIAGWKHWLFFGYLSGHYVTCVTFFLEQPLLMPRFYFLNTHFIRNALTV